MKFWPTILLLSATFLPPAAVAKKAAADFPATYTGGSLPLDHNKVRATLGKDEVIFMQGNRRIAVPLKDITEISCGTEARHHLVPLVHLGENENHYIGMAWTASAAPAQALLKLNRAEYRDFLAALEQSTGIKAVDTTQVPTVVHYKI